jgi:hypothetical protein
VLENISQFLSQVEQQVNCLFPVALKLFGFLKGFIFVKQGILQCYRHSMKNGMRDNSNININM